MLISEAGELVYPSDADEWSVSGVGDSVESKAIELAAPKLPVIESATGVGADSEVQA